MTIHLNNKCLVSFFLNIYLFLEQKGVTTQTVMRGVEVWCWAQHPKNRAWGVCFDFFSFLKSKSSSLVLLTLANSLLLFAKTVDFPLDMNSCCFIVWPMDGDVTVMYPCRRLQFCGGCQVVENSSGYCWLEFISRIIFLFLGGERANYLLSFSGICSERIIKHG